VGFNFLILGLGYIFMALSPRFVLVGTTHAGNIGAAARALKTMGLHRLYVVAPKVFPHIHATEMAAGAQDVLMACQVTDTLDEALVGCHLVIGTSARPRHLDLPPLTPRACAALVGSQSDDSEVAIVFGRERTGLTNEELLRCHYHVAIPANPEYSSLNLAQAVQIIAYEWRMQILAPEPLMAPVRPGGQPATSDEIEGLQAQLEQVLLRIHFLKPSNQQVLARMRRLVNRAGLEQKEVRMLRGMLTQVQLSLPSVTHE